MFNLLLESCGSNTPYNIASFDKHQITNYPTKVLFWILTFSLYAIKTKRKPNRSVLLYQKNIIYNYVCIFSVSFVPLLCIITIIFFVLFLFVNVILEHIYTGDKSVTCSCGHNQLVKVNFAYLAEINDEHGRLALVPMWQSFRCTLCDNSAHVEEGCYNCPECRTFCYCSTCYDLQLSPRTSFSGIKERLYQRVRFRGDYSFWLWLTLFAIFYFGLLNFFGSNIDSTCPESCDYELSLEASRFCTCDPSEGDGDKCGVNSDGEKLECVSEGWPEWQRIVLGVVPGVIYVINALYFIFSMDVSPLKAFFMPVLFIPAGLIAWVCIVYMYLTMYAMIGPLAMYRFAVKKYRKTHPRTRKRKRNSDINGGGKDTDVQIDKDFDDDVWDIDMYLPDPDTLILSYNEEDHYHIFTEIELCGVAIMKGDWKLFIYWAIMLVLTYFILIFGLMEIYNPIDNYECGDKPSECILMDSVGRCQDDCQIEDDIDKTCGVDSDGNEMICKLAQNNTVLAWQYTILGTCLGDFLIVFAGLKWICHMKWAKAFCHSISLTSFLLVGWVPTGLFMALYFLVNDVL